MAKAARWTGWVVLTLAAVATLSCKKQSETPAESAPAAAPSPIASPSAPEAVTGTVEDAGQAAAPTAPAGGQGTIEGEVVFSGTAPAAEPLKRNSDAFCAKTPMNDERVMVKGGKLQNVVVRVTGLKEGAVPTEPVVVTQEACMYRPRVQGAMKGQALKILNADGTMHNVHAFDHTKTLFNQAQPAKAAPVEKPIPAVDVVRMQCDVHPWMTGYVVYADNPHFATTGADGKFSLKGVPAGTYTLVAWHEKLGEKSASVTVTADGTANVSIAY